jgi:hypothetical protein
MRAGNNEELTKPGSFSAFLKLVAMDAENELLRERLSRHQSEQTYRVPPRSSPSSPIYSVESRLAFNTRPQAPATSYPFQPPIIPRKQRIWPLSLYLIVCSYAIGGIIARFGYCKISRSLFLSLPLLSNPPSPMDRTSDSMLTAP